ncbi:EAL domain-containing protein (plasmid) [Pseudomonas fluorescens]|uniref:EAL domain-containing protein n=1 Tax=Pseudomonas TaxID=286 RepID=UPI001F13A629|nr:MULTISPECIES: EAL domain-containing protein [Pseudomonas]
MEFDDKGGSMESLGKIFEKRFTVHFQPIVDMKTLKLVRYEALSRPLGFVQDTETLIHQMERTGEIRLFDQWVADTVIKTLSQLHDGPEVAINLSAKSLCDPLFHDEMEWILSRKADHVKIEFEITESQAIRDMSMAKAFVKRLKDHGCKVGLDDFGTGHARFRVVEELGLDYMKLSSHLTTMIDSSRAAQQVIIKAVAACKARGIPVVAEHIDNPKQYAWLRDIGIDHGQGWLFSKAGKELLSQANYKSQLDQAIEQDRAGKPPANVHSMWTPNPN